jgi:valyl-tRNA synthetase
MTTVLVAERDLEKERERLEGDLALVDGEIARAEALLANQDFVSKAPHPVVEKEREKLTRYLEEREKLRQRLGEIRH